MATGLRTSPKSLKKTSLKKCYQTKKHTPNVAPNYFFKSRNLAICFQKKREYFLLYLYFSLFGGKETLVHIIYMVILVNGFD
jgi:hypothetical protein